MPHALLPIKSHAIPTHPVSGPTRPDRRRCPRPRSRDPAARRMGVCGVDRFVSNYQLRLDAKGRVSIPAPFRAILARDGHEGLFLYPSLEAEALDCGGNALKQAIDDVLARYSPYSDQWETLSVALYGASEVLKIDARGPRGAHGDGQADRGDHHRGDLRRPGDEVPDLGARPVPRALRRGQASIARGPAGLGLRIRGASAAASWSTGNDGRRRPRSDGWGCRWRTSRHVPVPPRGGAFRPPAGGRHGRPLPRRHVRRRWLHRRDPLAPRHARAGARPRPDRDRRGARTCG